MHVRMLLIPIICMLLIGCERAPESVDFPAGIWILYANDIPSHFQVHSYFREDGSYAATFKPHATALEIRIPEGSGKKPVFFTKVFDEFDSLGRPVKRRGAEYSHIFQGEHLDGQIYLSREDEWHIPRILINPNDLSQIEFHYRVDKVVAHAKTEE